MHPCRIYFVHTPLLMLFMHGTANFNERSQNLCRFIILFSALIFFFAVEREESVYSQRQNKICSEEGELIRIFFILFN